MIRVLIVDDDKLARKGLISIMPWQKWGMAVVGEAPNGLKALEFLAQEPVDLMFVDLSMPVMSGIELMRQAKPLYPALQFVVLTFHEDFGYVQTCIRLGALDYISKLKLETEDYNSIFEGIAARMNHVEDTINTASPPDHADMGGSQPQEDAAMPLQHSQNTREQDLPHRQQADSLEQDWLNLVWLFDDLLFDRLRSDTASAKLQPLQAVSLLTRALAGAETLSQFPIMSNIRMESMDAALQTIAAYRSQLHAHAAHSTDLSTTAICMLKSAQYIRDHMTDPLHTDEVAGHVNMSRSYFCQCFKRQFGQTFNEYVRSRRIHLAKEYLLKTQQTISWIAQAVGYGDIKYFSHVFREQEFLLPSEFRMLNGNGDK